MNVAEIKAYQEKINAQLQEAKAVLDGLEAHATGRLAQSEIDAINRFKATNQEIDKKLHHDLKTAGEVAVAAKVKADIDAEKGQEPASRLVSRFPASQKRRGATIRFVPSKAGSGSKDRQRKRTSLGGSR